MGKTKTMLDLSVYAGEILLSSGAEIKRVQETMRHMLDSFGIQKHDVYVLANGIFATAEEGDEKVTTVREVRLGNVHMARVAAVNEISRSMKCGEEQDLEALQKKLEECANLPSKPVWFQAIGCALGSAGFCYLLGGQLLDCIPPFIAGIVLQYMLSFFEKRKASAYVVTILGALMVSLLCWGLWRVGVGFSLNKMITGSIMALVPGIALTMAIRDFFQEDYLSGSIHVINALLKAACIAVGVVVALQLVNFAGGLL